MRGWLPALLAVAALAAYCRYLAGYLGSDVPAYAAATAFSLLGLRHHRFLSRGFLLHVVFVQGITSWLCHFLLDPAYQVVTRQLVHAKGMLLGLFVLLELLACAHIVRRYRAARRQPGSFSSDAFADAVAPYPLAPPLVKLFLVEFMIWRALALRCLPLRDRDGAGLLLLGRIDTGYRRTHVLGALAAMLALNGICALVLPPLWMLAPLLACVYAALLLHCDLLQLARHGVYDAGDALVLANGIYGFVKVEKDNIARIVPAQPGGRHDLAVARLVAPTRRIELKAPLRVFGESVHALAVALEDSGALDALAAPGSGRDEPQRLAASMRST